MYIFFKLRFCFLVYIGFLTATVSSAQSPSYGYVYAYQDQQSHIIVNVVSPNDLSNVIELATITVPPDSRLHSAILSPDGNWIALIPVARGTNQAIHLVNILTGEVQTIPANLGFMENFPTFVSGALQRVAWSPNSQYLGFISSQGSTDVYLHSPADGTTLKLTNNEAYESRIAWSSDSNYVGILTEECLDYLVCATFIETFDVATKLQHLRFKLVSRGSVLADSRLCQLSWSPDNRYISFADVCNGSLFETAQEMTLLDVELESLTRMTDYTTSAEVPEFSFSAVLFGAYDAIWYDTTTLLIGVAHQNEDQTGVVTKTIQYNVENDSILPLLSTEMAHEWAIHSQSGAIAFRTSVNSVYDDASVKIATFNNKTLDTVFSLQAGCDLEWSPSGDILAYTNRGIPLSSCHHEMQGVIFFDRVSEQSHEFSLLDTRWAHPVGWITLENGIGATTFGRADDAGSRALVPPRAGRGWQDARLHQRAL